MKLYFSPYACSLAPQIVLEELGLPYDAVRVDLKAKRLEDGRDYREIVAAGYVPALELEDGELLTEVAAILQYLGDRKPGLLPAHGSRERYRTIAWLTFVATELHKGFSPLFNPAMPEAARSLARDRLAARLDLVEERLDGQEYLGGDSFSVVDAYAFTVLNWANGVGIDLARWPRLQAYFRRIKDRSSVRAAIRAQREPAAA